VLLQVYLMMRTLRDMNMSKYIAEDVPTVLLLCAAAGVPHDAHAARHEHEQVHCRGRAAVPEPD
jgi:hypothetical protein